MLQPSDDAVRVPRSQLAAAGGPLGGGNPLRLWTRVGEPLGGDLLTNGRTAIRHREPLGRAPLRRTIAVEGTAPAGTVAVTVNGQAAHRTGTHFQAAGVALVEGENRLVVTATDAAGVQTTSTATVSLVRPPSRPTLQALPEVAPSSPVTLTGTKASGTAIWLSVNGEAPAELVPADAQTAWSARLDLREGDQALRLSARDGAGLESTGAVALTLLDAHPPVLSDVRFLDADGTPLATDPRRAHRPKTNFASVTIAGRVDDSLTSVEINGQAARRAGRAFTVAEVPLQAGENRLVLIATSPNRHVTTETPVILRGTIPTLEAMAPSDRRKVYLGRPQAIPLMARDPDEDPLEVTLRLDDQALVPWSAEMTHAWTPTEAQRGPHTLTAEVRDAFGGSASQSVRLFVLRPPLVPPPTEGGP